MLLKYSKISGNGAAGPSSSTSSITMTGTYIARGTGLFTKFSRYLLSSMYAFYFHFIDILHAIYVSTSEKL